MKQAGKGWLSIVGVLAILLGCVGCTKKTVASPKNLQARVQEDLSVSISWEASADAEFYRVYRIEDNKVDYRFLCDVTDTSYVDKTAKLSRVYGYKVTALCGKTESEGCFSQKLTLTQTGSGDVTTPETPTITSVTNLDRYTTVVVFDSDNQGCTYQIMRSEERNGPYTPIGETREHAFYDMTLSDGESYFYTVTAANDTVASQASEPGETGMNSLQVFGAPVLMYHQFLTPEDVESGITFGEYAIWAADFEQDLQWLQKNGYTTITTAELMQYLNGEETPPEKPIILTIDDGYRGVYLNAWPLLKQYNMKAVFSVIGDRIDAAALEDPAAPHEDRLYCNWEELHEMQQSGYVEIISHTATCHNDEDMTNIRRGANCAEGESEESFLQAALPDYINISNNFREYFGFPAYAMSYPYSSRSVTSDRVWMRCGYQILYAGNSDDANKQADNRRAVGAGITRESAVLRRVARMHGTPVWDYIRDYYE